MDPPNPNPNFSALVDPQSYARQRQMIEEARMYINQVEAQNEAAFNAFTNTEQELQRRIRDGLEAQMLATQLRAGGFPQQTFIAQQPQVATWQTAPVPLPNVQENSFSTSARIEEVSPVSSGRASRSGSHSTFQQNDSSSYYRSRLYPQSAAPQNAGVPYDQSVNYGNVPVQSTTYTPHNFYTGQPPRQQSYYPPPPPSRPAYQPLPRQEPLHPVASASSPTSSRPVSVNNLPLPQPGPEPDQPTAQRTFVDQFTDFLQKHPFDVQLRVLTQIREYVSGKPTPNPQIRTWGDRLKQVGGSDPSQILKAISNKLSVQLKAQRAARSQTSQPQPQIPAKPPPQPPTVAKPQVQAAQPDQLPLPKATGSMERPADGVPPLSPAEQQTLNNLIILYARELRSAKVDQNRAGDFISAAYVSACLKQPPYSPDPWAQKTLDMFKQSFPIDRVPLALGFLLKGLGRPIPNVPAPTESRAVTQYSSSLVGALTDTASNIRPAIVTHQSSVVAKPLGEDAVVEAGAYEPLQEAQISRSDQELTVVPLVQVAVNAPHVSNQSLPPSNVLPVNPPHPTTTGNSTSIVSGDGSRHGHRPMDQDQLVPAQKRYFSDAISNAAQGTLRQPPASGSTQYHQPKVSTPSVPKIASVKVRTPRQADRSRLARDILKQLGKPTGTVPAVPTRREYKKRKKAEAEKNGTPAQPSNEPVAEPQSTSNRDDAPLLPKVGPANPPQDVPVKEPPSLGYPDWHTQPAPRDTNTVEQDVDMGIQLPIDTLVPQLSPASRPDPPHDSDSSLMASEALKDEHKSIANDPPPSETPSSRCNGPPPGTDIIEISDDEEQAVVGGGTAAVEPMEVDGEVRVGGAISTSLSRLSLDGEDVVVEMGEDRTKDLLDLRSSQEPVVSNGKKFTEKKSQKFQPYVELPPLPDYVRQIKGKERAPAKENKEDPELRAVVDLAFSRLRPTRCLWLGCRATLNSVDSLTKHLRTHADEVEHTSDKLECQWKKCTRAYRTRVKLDRHCMHHAQKVLHCPYEDCGEEFRDAGELLDHTKDMHENGDLLPSTNPIPYSGRTLDPLPDTVPSWSIFPASVAPVPISADRHSQIGRWVARNISGTAKRGDSSKRLRSSRRFDVGNQKTTMSDMEEMMNEERFGFISSTDDGNTMLADIPSEAVTLSCRYGLFVLSDDDGHHDAPQESGRERSGIGEIEVEDELVRADAPVGEDANDLELEPGPSGDELLSP